MKKIAILIILLSAAKIASATNYYISPSGKDSNTGTISSPFFTLNKAWSVVKAGDIIYARGGVYKYNSRQNLHNKSGTSSDTIRIWAYPGEKPVFTKSSSFTTPSFPVSLIYLKGSNYVHIRGIEISYFTQATSAVWYALVVTGSNNNKFEQINSHHNGNGMGVRDECNKNLILNCDFHHNNDPVTSFGNADGLSVAYHSSSVENTVKGCRFWLNSDDGLDLWQNNGNVIVDGCWAWKNGYRFDGITTAGDGCGFKFGSTTTQNGTTFKRTVTNNIAFANRTRGYMQNSANVRFNFFNNIAWKNAKGFVFATYNLAHVFRNNIVFDNVENWNGNYSNSVRDHNSNTPTPLASSADFITLDTTGVSRARQSNGNLPDINFMKLRTGSDLVDAGIYVGLTYTGSAPDLGPYEARSADIPPTTTPLSLQAATVKSTNPSEVEVTYNLDLASVVPATSCYEIKVNSVTRSISKMIISGKSVFLTLATPVNAGESVTLSYSKPSSNPLQCVGGSIAESVTAKSVVNSVVATAPKYVSAEIPDNTPDRLLMNYDSQLSQASLPPATSFTATINGVTTSVVSVAIAEKTVSLVLGKDVQRNDTVTIAYTQPSSNPLQTTTGGKAENLSQQTVQNNILGVSTGTDKLINDGKTLIYPNPAKEYIKIANFDPGDKKPVLQFYDLTGKLCQETKIDETIKTQKVLIRLKPGMYITRITIGENVHHTQKVVVVN